MIDQTNLNEMQRLAVFDESPALLVKANVGSGKTTVLIHRILHLVKDKNVSPSDLMVLTFTNKAADEIKERLSFFTEIDDSALIGTFHSIALTLLRTRLDLTDSGYRRDFTVITPEEELELALALMVREGLTIKYKNRLKKRLENPNEKDLGDDFPKLLSLLSREKKRLNKMTFSDLIFYATTLSDTTDYRPLHIIIDEVQDTDHEQLSMIDAYHKRGFTNLFVVGDQNQVIYSFRGSIFNVFTTLRNRYQAKELSLSVNYRSRDTILLAAHRFQEIGDKLISKRGGDSPLMIHSSYDPFQDAAFVADEIRKRQTEGIHLSDIAILYRLKSQADIYEKVLKEEGIPCLVRKKQSLREIPVLNYLLHLLTAIISDQDMASLSFILTDIGYGPGLKDKEALKLLTGNETKRPSKNTKKAMDFLQKVKSFQSDFRGSHEGFTTFFSSYMNLTELLNPTAASFTEDHRLATRFLKGLSSFINEKAAPARQLKQVKDYLSKTALSDGELSYLYDEDEEKKESVSLMTLHASKGLEFSHVFIVGVNNGLIPLGQGNEEEEERRLFFVGMTRAKDHLTLTSYVNPGHARVRPGPGSFLKMIPEKYTEGIKKEGPVTDFKTLKYMVLAEKEQSKKEEVRFANHPRYGRGRIVKEDDLMITVSFEGLGEKEFLKAFSELEIE